MANVCLFLVAVPDCTGVDSLAAYSRLSQVLDTWFCATMVEDPAYAYGLDIF